MSLVVIFYGKKEQYLGGKCIARKDESGTVKYYAQICLQVW